MLLTLVLEKVDICCWIDLPNLTSYSMTVATYSFATYLLQEISRMGDYLSLIGLSTLGTELSAKDKLYPPANPPGGSPQTYQLQSPQ